MAEFESKSLRYPHFYFSSELRLPEQHCHRDVTDRDKHGSDALFPYSQARKTESTAGLALISKEKFVRVL